MRVAQELCVVATSCPKYGSTPHARRGYESRGGCCQKTVSRFECCKKGCLSWTLTAICARDALRLGQKTGCRATHSCLWSVSHLQQWQSKPRNSSPLADRLFPTRCRDCTAILRSESSHPCPAASNWLRGQRSHRHPEDRSAALAFQLATRALYGNRSPAGLRPGQGRMQKTDVCDPCWLPSLESPRAIACCAESSWT